MYIVCVPPAAPPVWTAFGSNVTAGAKGKPKHTLKSHIYSFNSVFAVWPLMTTRYMERKPEKSILHTSSGLLFRSLCFLPSYQKPKTQLDL